LDEKIIGTVVCKLDDRQRGEPKRRGYIAMLAVDDKHRKLGIGKRKREREGREGKEIGRVGRM
jgi:ribosomal protein S18 acetylase RimI-like enzyme